MCLIRNLHESLGHPGISKLYITIKDSFIIGNIKRKILNIVQSCIDCSLAKGEGPKYCHVSGGIIAREPFNTLSIDILGPIETIHFNISNEIHEYFYIIVIVDVATRWTSCYTSYTIDSLKITTIVNSFLKDHKTVTKIITDQGRQFTSLNFRNMLSKSNIKHVMTTAHNPTANAIVERVNKNIGCLLRIYKGTTIKNLIDKIEAYHNLTKNRITGYSPYELLYKKSIFGETKYDDEIYEQQFNKTLLNIKKEIERRNVNRKKHQYKIGDLVFKKKNHQQDKVEPKWLGPYKIIKVINENNI